MQTPSKLLSGETIRVKSQDVILEFHHNGDLSAAAKPTTSIVGDSSGLIVSDSTIRGHDARCDELYEYWHLRVLNRGTDRMPQAAMGVSIIHYLNFDPRQPGESVPGMIFIRHNGEGKARERQWGFLDRLLGRFGE